MIRKKHRLINIVILILIVAVVLVSLIIFQPPSDKGNTLLIIKKGEFVYRENCGGCHYFKNPTLYSPSLPEMNDSILQIKVLKRDSVHKAYFKLMNENEIKCLKIFIQSYKNVQY